MSPLTCFAAQRAPPCPVPAPPTPCTSCYKRCDAWLNAASINRHPVSTEARHVLRVSSTRTLSFRLLRRGWVPTASATAE